MTDNFEPFFWDTLLQFSHTNPTVQQSLIALSAIYELYRNEGRLLANKALTSNYVLQQYTKAISSLVSYLSSENLDPRVALISCLILVWIELLQRNLELGFRHLTGGLKMLQEAQISGSRMKSIKDGQCDKEDIYRSLNNSFTRLRIQAVIHGSTSIGITMSLTREMGAMRVMPQSFSSVFESRMYLDNELNAIFGYMRVLRNHDRCSSFHDMRNPAIAVMQLTHLRRLEQWKKATDILMAGWVGQQKTSLTSSLLYLRMYYILVTISLKTFTGDEMSFDEHIPGFEQILVLSEKLLNKSRHENPPLFFSDMGIISPLFFVLLKCRFLRLRLKALELLRLAPEQEGIWFRDIVLKFCEWKISMEEAGRGNQSLYSLLPESARIYQEHIEAESQIIGSAELYLKYRTGPPHQDNLKIVKLSPDMVLLQAMGNML